MEFLRRTARSDLWRWSWATTIPTPTRSQRASFKVADDLWISVDGRRRVNAAGQSGQVSPVGHLPVTGVGSVCLQRATSVKVFVGRKSGSGLSEVQPRLMPWPALAKIVVLVTKALDGIQPSSRIAAREPKLEWHE